MIAAFPLTVHILRRPGIHGCPIGRARLASLQETFNSSYLSKQHFHGVHRYIEGSPGYNLQECNARPTIALYASLPSLSGQVRCANLWKNQPEESLRQRSTLIEKLLSPREVKTIFGPKVGQKDGNDLLKILQNQRHQGVLDQKLPYSDALIDKGLRYLRAKHPLDEDAAIIARIDRETDRGSRVPQTNIHESPHAVSQFEKFIQEQRRKHEEGKRDEHKTGNRRGLAEEDAKKEGRVTVRDRTALVQQRSEPEWIRRYRDKAHMKELPEMSALARLLPSGLVTLAVVTIAVLFAQHYKQPSRKARLWPSLPPAAATVLTLIGANVLVFVLWRVPPLWKFLNRYFLVVPAYPHSASMLTACFSHQSSTHLLVNMISLWLIGPRLHDDIGRGPFLAVYFSSAVIAAYIPMVIYVIKKFFASSTLGASGVVMALLATSCVLYEGQIITVPFLPPEWTRGVDTGVILAVFMLAEVMRMRRFGIVPTKLLSTGKAHTDSLGHFSGYLAGIGAGVSIRSTDPKWKNIERKHFFTKDFGKV